MHIVQHFNILTPPYQTTKKGQRRLYSRVYSPEGTTTKKPTQPNKIRVNLTLNSVPRVARSHPHPHPSGIDGDDDLHLCFNYCTYRVAKPKLYQPNPPYLGPCASCRIWPGRWRGRRLGASGSLAPRSACCGRPPSRRPCGWSRTEPSPRERLCAVRVFFVFLFLRSSIGPRKRKRRKRAKHLTFNIESGEGRRKPQTSVALTCGKRAGCPGDARGRQA